MGFEMTLLRMLAFRPAAEDGAPQGRPVRAAAPSAPCTGTARRRERPRPLRLRPRPLVRAAAGAERAVDSGAKARAGTGDWGAIVQSLDLRGPARQLADSCDLASNAGGAWQLVVPADKST